MATIVVAQGTRMLMCQSAAECPDISPCITTVCVRGSCATGKIRDGDRCASVECLDLDSHGVCNSEGNCTCNTSPQTSTTTEGQVDQGAKTTATTSTTTNTKADTTTTTSQPTTTMVGPQTATTRSIIPMETDPVSIDPKDLTVVQPPIDLPLTFKSTATARSTQDRSNSTAQAQTSNSVGVSGENQASEVGLEPWIIGVIAAAAGVVLIASVVAVACLIRRNRRSSAVTVENTDDNMQSARSETSSTYGAVQFVPAPPVVGTQYANFHSESLNGDYELSNIPRM